MTKLVVDFGILRPRIKMNGLETKGCLLQGCLIPEDGTNRSFQNIHTKVPFDSASSPQRGQIPGLLKCII